MHLCVQVSINRFFSSLFVFKYYVILIRVNAQYSDFMKQDSIDLGKVLHVQCQGQMSRNLVPLALLF